MDVTGLTPRFNRHVASSIAAHYGVAAFSDCEIVFCVKNGAEANGEIHAEQQLPGEPPLPAHRIVLGVASMVFSAQLARWPVQWPDNSDMEQQRPSKRPRSDSAPSGNGDRPTLRVLLDSKEDLPFASAAVKFAYTGEVEAGDVREALQVLHWGEHLGIRGCATACVKVIKVKLRAASSSNGAVVLDLGPVLELFACEALWPQTSDEKTGFSKVLAFAKRQLVRHFGDTIGTLNTPELREQLVVLPSAAMEALLETEDFGTDDESTTLLLLAMWMHETYNQTDASTRQRLGRLIRIMHLNRPYRVSVLPGLAFDSRREASRWAGLLPVSFEEAVYVEKLASAGEEELIELLRDDRAAFLWLGGVLAPPYTPVPRWQCLPVSGCRTFRWTIDQWRLEAVRENNKGTISRVSVFFTEAGDSTIKARGLNWKVYVEQNLEQQASAHTYLECELPSALTADVPVLREEGALSAGKPLDADIQLDRWRRRGGSPMAQTVFRSQFARKPKWTRNGWRFCLPYDFKLRSSTAAAGANLDVKATVAEAWADYLHNDQISGTLILRSPH